MFAGTFLFLDVWACLAVLDCCLQAVTPVEDEILLAVMAIMLEWRNKKEDWFLFNWFVYLCINLQKECKDIQCIHMQCIRRTPADSY